MASSFQRDGQRHTKDCSATAIGLIPQLSAMGLDDRAADRESQSHAVDFRGVEWLEEVLDNIVRQARSTICYSDLNRLVIETRCDHFQLAPFALRHRLARIPYPIKHDLLQLNSACKNRLGARIEVQPDLHTVRAGAR